MEEKTLSCENLVDALAALPKANTYSYINKATHTAFKIDNVEKPYGPITIRRWDPSKGETVNGATTQTISKEMLFRVANAVSEGLPINIDRVLGASYNTRSALETLICHVPQFYYCYLGRIENKNGVTKIKAGHKHVIWLPNEPHIAGELLEKSWNILKLTKFRLRILCIMLWNFRLIRFHRQRSVSTRRLRECTCLCKWQSVKSESTWVSVHLLHKMILA